MVTFVSVSDIAIYIYREKVFLSDVLAPTEGTATAELGLAVECLRR